MIWTNPLNWPPGWPNSDRISGSFKVSLNEAEQALTQELERLGASNAYLSSNNSVTLSGRPKNSFGNGSPEVVLHFTRANKQLTIPCDRFDDLRGNVRAIGLTLEAIRRMERYGTSQMMDAALAGFAALPPGNSKSDTINSAGSSEAWYDVLEVSPGASQPVIEAAYKAKLRRAHPDGGGSTDEFMRIQRAYKEATEN